MGSFEVKRVRFSLVLFTMWRIYKLKAKRLDEDIQFVHVMHTDANECCKWLVKIFIFFNDLK